MDILRKLEPVREPVALESEIDYQAEAEPEPVLEPVPPSVADLPVQRPGVRPTARPPRCRQAHPLPCALMRAVGVVLFLSSFAPLLVVFGLLHSFGPGAASYACYSIAGISVTALWVSFRSWRRLNKTDAQVLRARPRDSDVIAYVATYIVPFAALGAQTWQQRGALIGFFVLVGLLYIRANLFYVNPILAIFGFKLYEVETETGKVMLVISRATYLRSGSTLKLHTLSDYVYLDGA